MDKCIFKYIENQATLRPDSIALVYEDNKLTYKELNSQANQIAHHLRENGVGKNTIVGLYTEQSIEMIVGILAILKAGGAYAPLDPRSPKQRLDFIVSDTQLSIILTQDQLIDQIPKNKKVINLNNYQKNNLNEFTDNLINETKLENLAYVIYTSGTTGKPKGVQVTHGNLIHSTNSRILYYKEPPSCLLSLYSVAFDPSVAAIFWALCTNARLVIPKQDFQNSIKQVINLIKLNKVSHLMCLPSIYRLILESGTTEELNSLISIIVGGEKFKHELIIKHNNILPDSSLYNEYGPTEATIWCSVNRCLPEKNIDQYSIGQPIPNTKIYILDSDLKVVPTGEKGELHIGGKGVTNGYLNRPDITNEKFISTSFNKSKLYKTGDIGRFMSDGSIEFIGRSDDQVKIRGYRIELGEIETEILQHPGVKLAVAHAYENEENLKKLIVYLVCDHGQTPGIFELRTFLSARLPNYMIPHGFIFLDKIPVNENGKLDRKSLPPPEILHSEADYLAPRDNIEKELISIWETILSVSKLGINNDFFILGGDSLLAAQMLILIEKKLNIEVSLKNLYEKPTVSELAKFINKKITLNKEKQDLQLTTILDEIENMTDEEVIATLSKTK